MDTGSKPWSWDEINPRWLEPSEESYYLADRWKQQGRERLLDLGCGLGRHSIHFAKQGFNVSALDLSERGVSYLRSWAARERVRIDVRSSDMLELPFDNDEFDCLLAYHVISHTDTAGITRVISEIKRVLKPGGEFFLTLCSKETWSYAKAGYPALDENTVIKRGGVEDGIPHFYTDLDGVIHLFADCELIRVRHTDDCWSGGKKHDSRHYFVHGAKKAIQE